MSIQNVVFDIGNVFVRWTPFENLKVCFPDQEPQPLWTQMRSAWRDLNRGLMSMDAIIDLFHKETGLPREGFAQFCTLVMEQATIIPDSVAVQAQLAKAGVPLYFLSDNIREIIAYYRAHYDFMRPFVGGVASYENGFLKPEPGIYSDLFKRFDLDPASCVFFDDVAANVDGARQAGMTAFVFTDAAACARDLKTCGFLDAA